MKEQGRCIFCNETGLSKQHIWPDWLKKVITRDENKNTQTLFRYDYFTEDRIAITPEVKIREGYLGTRKIRNVCLKCNNGWMSQIEQRAKPHLITMIQGNKTTLTKSDLKDIITWIVMTSIMSEYTDVETKAISEEDRIALYQTQNIPNDGWLIWLGKYVGSEWKFRYRHHGGALQTREESEQLKKGIYKKPPNIQSTTLVFGELFINCISTPIFIIDKYKLQSDLNDYLICIHPNKSDKETFVNWPPKGIIDDALAMKIANRFFSIR
jgi:hypothetical protein